MTRTFPAALAACTLALVTLGAAPAPAAGQTGFEGVTTFKQYKKSDGTYTTLLQTTKGHKVRWQGMGSDSSVMIFDGDAHSMMIVQPEKKTYMTITEADMEQAAAMMKPMQDRMKEKKSAAEKDKDFDVDVKNTGRHETVAGVRCEVWHGTTTEDGKKKEGEACVAPGVGFAVYDVMLNNPMTRRSGRFDTMMAKYKQVLAGGKGVLKMTSIENGKTTVDMEATKIEKKSVSDDAFKPPAGYTGQSMGQMMQQAAQQMQMMKERMQKSQGKPSDKN
ncbi:MAG TPA: DUF4412 domain-containing protein [Gemmatimonadales bacterium]|jgi:hypothetical protein|nr:DUF4412 domain-containing protein [Gemmatimonadales bacterium]